MTFASPFSRLFFAPVCACALALACVARAQIGPAPEIYEQHLGDQLPLATEFTDQAGKTAPLTTFVDHTDPIVILFGYWHCPQLCSVISQAAIGTLRELRLTPDNRFDLVYVSIDKADTPNDARIARDGDLRAFAHAGAEQHWHYLVGTEEAVKTLADAAGFHYRYDPVTKQYAHPSGFLIATPDGKISRYFLGIDFPSEDVAQALHRARDGGVGRSTYELILTCFRGDQITGRYGIVIWHVLQGAVAATLLALFGGIGWMVYQEKRGARAGGTH